MNPLPLSYAVAEVPNGQPQLVFEANEGERAAVAAGLGVVSCQRLIVRYTLKPSRGGCYALDGTCDAHITQSCVVSLAPVDSTLSLPISVTFSPDPTVPATATAGDDIEVLTLPDLEPIEQGQLEVGRVIFETLAAGLDPYPRRPDAAFDWQDPKLMAGAGSAFAALAHLKPKT
jgi:hypothetical protein